MKLKEAYKAFLLISFIILYKYNENICEYFYPCKEITTDWWIFRLKIYALMFCMPLWSNTIKIENKKFELFEYVIFGIMTSDAVMFAFFNETEAGWKDLLGTVIITVFGYFNIYKKK